LIEQGHGTPADEQLYVEGLDQVQRLADARRTRLVAAEEGVPTVLWAVLILGRAAVIGLVLFTIGAREHSFSGGARIGTEAFELILERFETSKLSDLR
jgi:hypothetical protein